MKDGRTFFADILSMGLSMVLENEVADCPDESVLVSVPTHPEDHPDRNDNPPDMLAGRIAVHSHLPYRPDSLIKVEPHSQKDHTSCEERFEEIQGVFTPNRTFDEERVFLVDDLMTTGATASECARICLKGGASSVHVLAAGRNFHFLEDREYG
ncbi:MAG: hypothetical protein GQ558_02445 [Thermoplasmata archaeon]|nr:hypothetical protein [Thermoplasmata archaeon]